MPSSEEYLQYVLELLRGIPDISCKRMMGEYLLYKEGVLFGGVYDNRFLVKKTKSLEERGLKEQIPYPSAKPMYLVDCEDAEEVARLIELACRDLGK
ncbi:MAG: TfoX/Sxy family protein [Bacilli bacterium]|nr:TfoX/Sxy family protein [Bacilli bacterium]